MVPYFNLMSNAIIAMHRKHSTGDVKEVRQYADGKIEIVLSDKVYRGRVIQLPSGRGKIYLHQHQLTVQIIGL